MLLSTSPLNSPSLLLMWPLHCFLVIIILASSSSQKKHAIKNADSGMMFVVEGDYEDNDKQPSITFRTSGGRIPVEVTLLGNGITQISVKEGSEETRHTEVTNRLGYVRGDHVKLIFTMDGDGTIWISRDHLTKDEGSIISVLLSTVPFHTLTEIVTRNLANENITDHRSGAMLSNYHNN